jgi:hypothetical protein
MSLLQGNVRPGLYELPTLLRGEAQPIQSWIANWSGVRLGFYGIVITLGSAAFGAAIGAWRDPLQGLFTAIKFPLIILLTTIGNGLLNGMLAPLLGVNISFRQSLLCVYMSFTIAALVLGAFSPIIGFIIWNSAPLQDGSSVAAMTHSGIFVLLFAAMGIAGIAGNLRLLELLRDLGKHKKLAGRTMLGWLLGNLLLGSQLTWILRPFVGSPSLPVEFIRPNAFEGNLFEALYHHAKHLFS